VPVAGYVVSKPYSVVPVNCFHGFIVLYVPHDTATHPEEIEAIFFTGALADLLSFIDREELLALFPETSPLRCTRAGDFRPVVVLSHDHGNHFTLYRE
jgi:hypothetical protein